MIMSSSNQLIIGWVNCQSCGGCSLQFPRVRDGILPFMCQTNSTAPKDTYLQNCFSKKKLSKSSHFTSWNQKNDLSYYFFKGKKKKKEKNL